MFQIRLAPRTRGECIGIPRPCPFIGCRYHLASDRVQGKLVVHTNDIESMRESCALDVADRGSHTLEYIAEFLGGITRERTRQLMVMGLRKMRGMR